MDQDTPRRARQRVLVVDDELAIADTLAMILEAAGFEVHACYDGMSALADAMAHPPDILVSDVMMPKLDGLRLAARLRERYSACRILLISGNSTGNDLIEEWEAGGGEAFEILSKPLHPQVLIRKLLSPPDPQN